jgi:hypothetical protein
MKLNKCHSDREQRAEESLKVNLKGSLDKLRDDKGENMIDILANFQYNFARINNVNALDHSGRAAGVPHK